MNRKENGKGRAKTANSEPGWPTEAKRMNGKDDRMNGKDERMNGKERRR